MWSEFTKNNINKIKLIKKEYITSSSLLLKNIKKDRKNIMNLHDIKFNIENIKISKQLLQEMISSEWVYKGVLNELNNLPNEYLISWYTNNKLNKI